MVSAKSIQIKPVPKTAASKDVSVSSNTVRRVETCLVGGLFVWVFCMSFAGFFCIGYFPDYWPQSVSSPPPPSAPPSPPNAPPPPSPSPPPAFVISPDSAYPGTTEFTVSTAAYNEHFVVALSGVACEGAVNNLGVTSGYIEDKQLSLALGDVGTYNLCVSNEALSNPPPLGLSDADFSEIVEVFVVNSFPPPSPPPDPPPSPVPLPPQPPSAPPPPSPPPLISLSPTETSSPATLSVSDDYDDYAVVFLDMEEGAGCEGAAAVLGTALAYQVTDGAVDVSLAAGMYRVCVSNVKTNPMVYVEDSDFSLTSDSLVVVE